MTIEIISASLEEEEGSAYWITWLEISNNGLAYLLPANAPGTLAKNELQNHFAAQEAALFSKAQSKGINAVDIYDYIPKKLLKAIVKIILDEINILRNLHGLPARTEEQARTAVKNTLQSN